jgi:DNA invertase Pin-like site-specific DNA recombinase
VAKRHGWKVVGEFSDPGISGGSGRGKRPGLDALLHAVARREVEMVMAWSVDRLGRSLQDLVAFLGELHAKRVDLYLHQQGLDTTTPAGKALFQMLGVFAEFERAIIRERVRSGLERAKAHGKTLGRRRNNDPARAAEVRRMRANGTGIGKEAGGAVVRCTAGACAHAGCWDWLRAAHRHGDTCQPRGEQDRNSTCRPGLTICCFQA